MRALVSAFVLISLPGIFLQGRADGMDGVANVAAVATGARAPGGAEWAFDPDYTGEQLPPAGRSLFDYLFTADAGEKPVYRIPYPFSALREMIEARLHHDRRSRPIRQVLIPHGRSLQRGLAAPGYFNFPRVVLAVVGEPDLQEGDAGMLLKDRLYIGYQEKADLLEVISYNEAAARFEFQIVRNYARDRDPEVFYANRSVCLACHQNHAPIFSRPLWSETGANPEVAAALRRADRDFYGIKVEQGIDIPNAIDDATDRANLFAVTQALWRKGCGTDPAAVHCRAYAFTRMLRYSLAGKQGLVLDPADESPGFGAVFATNWQQHWPDGMAIPNPDIPNRNPLESAGVIGQMDKPPLDINVVASVDPLAPRSPLETWSREQAAGKVITGLSALVAGTDISRLDAFIYEAAKDVGLKITTHSFACELSTRRSAQQVYRISFRCPGTAGRVYIDHDRIHGGSIDRLQLGNIQPVTSLDIVGGSVYRDAGHERITLDVRNASLHARLANGNAIDSVELYFKIPAPDDLAIVKKITGELRVNELADFALVHQAVGRMQKSAGPAELMLFSDQAFQRSRMMGALFRELGMPALNWCCESVDRMPAMTQAARTEDHPTANSDGSGFSSEEKRFFQYCASCHQSGDRFPPNFLNGSTAQVRAALNHCARRIQVRLKMWNYLPESRSKSPMPPFRAIHQQYPDSSAWQQSEDLRALQDYISRLPGMENQLSPESRSNTDYESLRECLPAVSP